MGNRIHIKLISISKSFIKEENGQHSVFDNFSIEIFQGEVLSIVGASGCGKTTLLKLIGGLTNPDNGEIDIDNYNLSNNNRSIGFMFQNPVLLPWLTIQQNIFLPYKLNNPASGSEELLIDRVDDLIRFVGLEGFSNSYPNQLSGGMQSRAALARSLFLSPKILLLDEPFGSLDAITREEMQRVLLRILVDSKATVVLVTHSIEEALLISDRLIVLSRNPASIIYETRLQDFDKSDSAKMVNYITNIKQIILNNR